jgi:hypothetical protein
MAGRSVIFSPATKHSPNVQSKRCAKLTHPNNVGSRTYPEYVKWSLTFDWLYNYPGFDNELKDRVAAELLRAAEKMLQDQSLKQVQLAMYHNYTVRY